MTAIACKANLLKENVMVVAKSSKMLDRSPSEVLAFRFVTEILGQQWDYRKAMQHLSAARDIVNPKTDSVTGKKPETYSIDDAIACCKTLQAGTIKAQNGDYVLVKSLRCLFWGTPSYIEQYVIPPSRPAIHESVAYDNWVRKHGKRAVQRGLWDGIYRRWDNIRCKPGEHGLSVSELVMCVNIESAQSSVYQYICLLRAR
jgi:hypothetical protein